MSRCVSWWCNDVDNGKKNQGTIQSDPATWQGVGTKRGHPRGRLVPGNINFTMAERDSGRALLARDTLPPRR